MIGPKVRAAGLHLGTGVAASIATVMWMSSHSVDLYATVDQMNTVVADLTKLLATISLFVGGAIQIWKATAKGLAADVTEIAKTPGTPLKGLITEDSPDGRAFAASIPGPVVSAGSIAAKAMAE